jgi:hypothetical protein
MATTTVSLDLDSTTLDRLAERERATGETRSQLAQRYIEEGLRMERYPGIFFQDGPTGRRAVVLGGPDVWELVPDIRDLNLADDAEIEATAAWLRIPEARIRSAIGYYAEFRDEIDDRIERNRALGEKLEAAWRAERGLPPR